MGFVVGVEGVEIAETYIEDFLLLGEIKRWDVFYCGF